MAKEFYLNLYTRDSFTFARFLVQNAFLKLNEIGIKEIKALISTEEIKMAVFNMFPLKALGPDGLHAMFFQNEWDIMGRLVCDLMQEIFKNPQKIRENNDTILLHVLKVNNPKYLKQFKPISLCNGAYKIITKLIVNRLKPYLSYLISSNQCNFILGRHSIDNVIMAQEMIHAMQSKKGKKGWISIKMNFEKVYDGLNWDFLENTLNVSMYVLRANHRMKAYTIL